MKSIAVEAFLDWAGERGLALDPRYPDAAVLGFTGGSSEARFWSIPPEPAQRPDFLKTTLRVMGNWKSCFAWRHLGNWPRESAKESDHINDAVECQILAGLGLPLGSANVVEFRRADLAALVTLLFSTTVFGWSVGEDLYVVPDHARCVLQTDHHDVIHVACRRAEDMALWVSQMKTKGYELPERVPDRSFKEPSWMRRDR